MLVFTTARNQSLVNGQPGATNDTGTELVATLRDAARTAPDGALSPRCIEYFDDQCLGLARKRIEGVPDGAACALFCEQEVATADAQEAHLTAWWEALEAGGALASDTVIATDDTSRKQLHALRHAIPAGINEEVVRNGMPKLGTDLSVPDDALTTMMEAYDKAPIRHVLFGHIGNNHLHLNLLPKTPDELATAKAFYDDLSRLAISLGGSVSGEHGIGKAKVKQLGWMVGDATIAAFADLKRALDPHWILGRGTMIAAPSA